MNHETRDHLVIKFNDSIESWIAYGNSYNLTKLVLQPEPNSWSAGQLIKHIIQDTAFHIDKMKLALADNQFSDRPMHPNGILMFSANQFPDTRIVGHPDNALIAQPATIEELVKGLSDLQHEVQQLYRTFDIAAAMGKSEHPGLWYFTAAEWLQFTEMHMRHHLRQKKRIDDFLLLRKTSS